MLSSDFFVMKTKRVMKELWLVAVIRYVITAVIVFQCKEMFIYSFKKKEAINIQ